MSGPAMGGGGNGIWLPACSPNPQNSHSLPSTGRTKREGSPVRTHPGHLPVKSWPVWNPPSDPHPSLAGFAVSSPLPQENPIWGHEENTDREDRCQPDLEEGQESGQDWTREDKTYWEKKRKFTVGRSYRECLSQISTYLFRSFCPEPSGHHFTSKCSVEQMPSDGETQIIPSHRELLFWWILGYKCSFKKQ